LVSLWNKSKYVSCQNKAKCNTVLRNFIIANSDVWSTQANKIHKHILIIQKQWATGKLPQSLESFPLPWSLKVLKTLKQIYYSTWAGKKTNHFFFFWEIKANNKVKTLQSLLHLCNGTKSYGAFPHILCFSSSLKYLDDSIQCTFPESFYRC
jgi:hypothetical protein